MKLRVEVDAYDGLALFRARASKAGSRSRPGKTMATTRALQVQYDGTGAHRPGPPHAGGPRARAGRA